MKYSFIKNLSVVLVLCCIGVSFNTVGQQKLSATAMKKKLDEAVSKKNKLTEIEYRDQLARYYYKQKQYDQYFFQMERIPEWKATDSDKIKRRLVHVLKGYAGHLNKFQIYDESIRINLVVWDIQQTMDEFPGAFTLSQIAGSYQQLGDDKSAEKYYFMALEASKNQLSRDHFLSSYNNLGLFYRERGDLRNAKKYFKLGVNYIEENGLLRSRDSVAASFLYGNLGGIYLNLGDVETGITFLKKDIKLNFETRNYHGGINALHVLAEIQMEKHNYVRALEILKESESKLLKLHASVSSTRLKSFELMSEVYAALGNVTRANQYLNKYIELSQQNTQAKAEQQAIARSSFMRSTINNVRETTSLEIRGKEQRIKILETEKRYLQAQYIIWGVLALFLISMIWLLSRQKLIRRKARITQLEMEKKLEKQTLELERLEQDRLKEELHFKSKDLTDFALEIQRSDNLLNSLKDKIRELKIQSEDGMHRELNSLLRFITTHLNVNESVLKLRNNVEQFNHKFLATLSSKFPELTESEKELCGMIRTRLSNKEIAILRQSSYEAARIARYRLRKKLELDPEVNLSDFLNKL